MAIKVREVRRHAGKHSRTAIRTLAAIMRSPQSAAASRVAAAKALLDRGWGKPKPAPDEEVDCLDPEQPFEAEGL